MRRSLFDQFFKRQQVFVPSMFIIVFHFINCFQEAAALHRFSSNILNVVLDVDVNRITGATEERNWKEISTCGPKSCLAVVEPVVSLVSYPSNILDFPDYQDLDEYDFTNQVEPQDDDHAPFGKFIYSRNDKDGNDGVEFFNKQEGIFRSSKSRFPPSLDLNQVEDDASDDDNQELSSIPLAYRFYRRSASAHHRVAWSAPLVLIGPNVDHWKATGEELAAMGFSAIACERVPTTSVSSGIRLNGELEGEQSAKLILDLLDALCWNRAVLVACDSETVLAIQAAMLLAPHRIVGVVLCGSLDVAEQFVNRMQHTTNNNKGGKRAALDPFSVDRFLRQHVICPFAIVWDGDGDHVPSPSSSSQAGAFVPSDANNDFKERIVILGSGRAPHRRRPELLAWTLARFVELRVAPWHQQVSITGSGSDAATGTEPWSGKKQTSTNRILFLDDVSDFFSQEGMFVIGRAVARILIYWTAIRVGLYQYQHCREGIFNLQARLKLFTLAVAKFLAFLAGLFSSSTSHAATYGSLPSSPGDDSPVAKQSESLDEKRNRLPNEDLVVEPDNKENKEGGIQRQLDERVTPEAESPPTNSDQSALGKNDTEQSIRHENKKEYDEEPVPFTPNFLLDYVIA